MWYWIFSILITISIAVIVFIIEIFLEGEGLFTFLCLILCISTFTTTLPNENNKKGELVEYQTEVYKIIGLETNKFEESHLNGHFLLGYGHINDKSEEKMKYIYFIETEYGKQLKSIDADNSYIKETNEEQPKLIQIEQEIHRKANWIDRGFGHKKNEEIVTNHQITGYILVVPKNTIKIDYNIDI